MNIAVTGFAAILERGHVSSNDPSREESEVGRRKGDNETKAKNWLGRGMTNGNAEPRICCVGIDELTYDASTFQLGITR